MVEMEDGKECVILMDNGSLRAAATWHLRDLADGLSRMLCREVHPVSLLHSSKVDAAELGGVHADTLIAFLKKARERGVDKFRIVPLFFGPSEALTVYLPERVGMLREAGWEKLVVELAEPLAVDEAGVNVVAGILCERVLEVVDRMGWKSPKVALVDHGTPAVEVNTVRNDVARRLQALLAARVSGVWPCSMERRDGAEYDFNEPMLASLLGDDGLAGKVVVAMMFLCPGRHAGVGGDVWEICEKACRDHVGLEVAMTGLVGDGAEELIQLLAAKYEKRWRM